MSAVRMENLSLHIYVNRKEEKNIVETSFPSTEHFWDWGMYICLL